MPRRFKRKRSFKRSKKRTFRKRRRPTGRSSMRKNMTIVHAPSFMPDTLITRMKFAETHFLVVSAATEAADVYQGNGIFDPSPFAGTSVTGFQELATIYDAWLVTSSSIQFRIVNPAPSTMEVSLIPTRDAASSNFNPMDYVMNAYGKGVLLTPAGGSKDAHTFFSSASSRTMFGQPLSQGSFYGSNINNPVLAWEWIFALRFPTTTTQTVHFNVIINYTVKWVRKNLIDPTP